MLFKNTFSVLSKSLRFISRSNCLNNTMKKKQYTLSNMEKRYLVWTGKYKTVEEVPAMVPADVFDKARNKMRIKVANYMMAGTLIACIIVSMSGKRAHERGESVSQQNLAWHKEYNQQAEKSSEK